MTRAADALAPRRVMKPVQRAPHLLAVALILTACATPTPYRPAPEAGAAGFSERRIEQRRYRVSFRGNAQTPRGQVEIYLLYRAAEIAAGAGAPYFRVVAQGVEADTTFLANSVGFQRFGYAPYAYRRFGGFGATTTLTPITRYEAVATILLLEPPRPADDAQIYSAADVLRTLGPSIRRAP